MTKTVNFNLSGTLSFIEDVADEIIAVLKVRYGNFETTLIGGHMAYTLPVGMAVDVMVAYSDARGNPAAVDGPVVWDSSSTDVVTAVASNDDPSVCRVSAVNLGSAQVNATADADLGAGVKTLVTTMTVTVVAGEAVAGTISPVGEPIPIP